MYTQHPPSIKRWLASDAPPVPLAGWWWYEIQFTIQVMEEVELKSLRLWKPYNPKVVGLIGVNDIPNSRREGSWIGGSEVIQVSMSRFPSHGCAWMTLSVGWADPISLVEVGPISLVEWFVGWEAEMRRHEVKWNRKEGQQEVLDEEETPMNDNALDAHEGRYVFWRCYMSSECLLLDGLVGRHLHDHRC